MKTGIIFLLTGLFVCFTIISLSEESDPDEGKTIQKIEVVGLKRQNSQTILSQFQTKENSPFSRKTIKEDIERLNKTGLFTTITWQTKPVEKGVEIIINVTENDLIENIYFEGFKSVSVNSFQSELRLKPDEPFNEFSLWSDLRLIREKYREKGYHFVEVSSRRSNGLRGIIVAYSVREGPYVTVNEVHIIGNNAFPPTSGLFGLFGSDQVRDKMSTKTNSWLASHIYNESELAGDLIRIENFYRDEGWLDTNAFIKEVVFSEDKTEVDITLNIEENARYYLRNLNIISNTAISTAEILKGIKIKPGIPYRLMDVSSAIRSIKRQYGKLGMVDCDIDPRPYYSKEEGVVDISFHINEGERKYLEKINIAGNHKTRDKVIRRNFVIYPGDLMDYEKIETSQERVASTMFFKDLKYDLEDGSAPDRKNILLTVDEAPTGNVQIGGGFSSSSGFGGMISLSQKNFDISRLPESFGEFFTGKSFAGGGQKFSLSWRPGVVLSQFGVSFTEPYLFNKPLQLGLDYGISERSWSDYDEGRITESVFLSRRFAGGWETGLGTRVQRIEITNVDSEVSSIITELEGANRLVSLTPSLGLDKRNSWLFPSKGYRFGLDFVYTGGFLGGDFDFTKTIFRAEAYTPLIPDQKKLVLNLVAKFGRVTKFDDTTSVPFFERFYAGGVDTVRGFEYRTISPKDEDDLPIGGNILSIFNLEATYPLYSQEVAERPFDVARFVIFFDAGNVVNKFNDLELSDYRTSVGFGFRLYLGNIPLNLYAGYPLKKQDEDERETIQLDFGFMY